MTLITITAPGSGPVAIRQGDLIIPGTEVAFGGFSSLLGYKSTDSATDPDEGDRDVYLLGMTNSGLQLARVGINGLTDFAKYTFWDPQGQNFSAIPPNPNLIVNDQIYLPGTFSSGSTFYSPYFMTFVIVYFNKMADSTFYMRYLQLDGPLGTDTVWIAGGKNGNGIEAEDVEALVRYTWSAEQKLYTSTPGPGGFNYAGMPHPEYFNTQYFPQSLYPDNTPAKQRVNDWYGPMSRSGAGGDGKNLLLSWTEQVISLSCCRSWIHTNRESRRSVERTAAYISSSLRCWSLATFPTILTRLRLQPQQLPVNQENPHLFLSTDQAHPTNQ